MQRSRQPGRPTARTAVAATVTAALLLAPSVLADMQIVQRISVAGQTPQDAQPDPPTQSSQPVPPPRDGDVSAPPTQPAEPVIEPLAGVAPEAPPIDAPGGVMHAPSCSWLHAYAFMHVRVSDINMLYAAVERIANLASALQPSYTAASVRSCATSSQHYGCLPHHT